MGMGNDGVDRLRELLAKARATSPATVADEAAAMLVDHPSLKTIYAVIEANADDSYTFSFVLNAVLNRHPNHFLRGFGDSGAAADILASEDAAERRRG